MVPNMVAVFLHVPSDLVRQHIVVDDDLVFPVIVHPV